MDFTFEWNVVLLQELQFIGLAGVCLIFVDENCKIVGYFSEKVLFFVDKVVEIEKQNIEFENTGVKRSKKIPSFNSIDVFLSPIKDQIPEMVLLVFFLVF